MERLTKFPPTPFAAELARELLTTYGSPLYVYDRDILCQTIRHITRSIPYPRTQFHFASVTNGNVALLQIFRQEGWGLHANTPGDIYLGMQAGFTGDRIIYTGSNLNREEMEQVLFWGVKTLNFDSIAQLKLYCETYQNSSLPTTHYPLPNVGLRLNLPFLTGDSRIGVRPEEFTEAIAIAKQAGLKVTGLHFYRGTGTNATTAFTSAIDTVLATAQNLPDWEYLDFGGGFGYPYHHDSLAFDWELFGTELTNSIAKLGKKINLIIEPGRAAIAKCATLLAKVVSVKWQDGKQIIGVDTTVANLAVPNVHGGYREITTWKDLSSDPSPARGVGGVRSYLTDICGNTTYSRDYLGKHCQLPKLEIGDPIAILDVGAYGYAMSSHFLHRPKPAEVLLANGRHRLIRQREDYGVLLTNQIFDREE